MRFFTLFFSLFICSNIYSQVAVKVMQYRPTGVLGSVMKKGFGIEIMKLQDHLQEDYRLRIGIGYTRLNPRLDTFPTASYQYSNGQYTIFPGYQTYDNFSVAYGFMGMDYIGGKEKTLKLYPGADVLVGGFDFDYSLKNSFKTEQGNGSYMFFGLRLRAGALYHLSERINIHFEATRAYNLLDTKKVWTANDISLNFQYIF